MNKPDEINKDILIRASAGDLQAFEAVLFFYEKAIYNYCLHLVKNSQHAKDIAQDTFIKVYLHRREIDPAKNIKTWIFTIATNTAYDFLRGKKQALLLFYQQGFSYKEIAEILGIPINTVKTYISRGKEQLKDKLQNYSA
jgi:DNA-directed RNA polymerase specialized sigma24 family protein